MRKFWMALKPRERQPTRWIFSGLMAGLLAAGVSLVLPMGSAALAEEEKKGGHSSSGETEKTDGGNAKAQGRSAQERANRHRVRTGQTLGGGERSRNRYGGHKGGDEPEPETPDGSDAVDVTDIGTISEVSLSGGGSGAEHFTHDGTDYWGVDGKVLRSTASAVLPQVGSIASSAETRAAALGSDCSDYRPESLAHLRMQGSNRARLGAAQALLAPGFAAEGKVSGLSLLAEYQTEAERLRSDQSSAALYLASVSTRPVTVALIQAVNSALGVASSQGVAAAIAATAEAARIEMAGSQ